jgi:salicylate biosynthesis isochorismate synthase/menaquinone-specific isochorismate synthase
MAFWGSARRTGRPPAPPETGFGRTAYARFAERIDAAERFASERGSSVIASITVALDPAVDPLAHLQTIEPRAGWWTAYAQPAHDDFMLVTFDSARRIRATGADRFDRLAEEAASALEAAFTDDLYEDPEAPRGSGLVWTGGFAFLDAESYGDSWREFCSSQFSLPRASIVRRRGEDPQARLTLNVDVEPGASTAGLLAEVEELVDAMKLDRVLTAGEPKPASDDSCVVTSVASAEHYERAVAEGAAEIKAGKYEKIVLAREVALRREREIDPFAAFRELASRFPECTTFAISEFETTFIGASPELLVRREGRRAATMALAGSTRRGADPATDEHLGEQLLASEKNRVEHEIVVRRIERVLGRYSAWIAAAREPEIVKVKNIQHLATPIRAQLTEPRPVIELAGALHPTPAVGGEPWEKVKARIPTLEGFDRGWYAGAIGWMDQFEDGEFHVALRSALIDGKQARLFAGCGIVGDSDPAAELAETETKLEALLPVLRAS